MYVESETFMSSRARYSTDLRQQFGDGIDGVRFGFEVPWIL